MDIPTSPHMRPTIPQAEKEEEQGRRPPQPHAYTASDIERLGRERPKVFTSLWMELGFGFSLLGSMFVAEYFISGFNTLLPSIASALSIPPSAQTWPASVFALVTGAFLLPMGRMSDIFGGYVVFNAGLLWFLVWSVIAGFSRNYVMLIVCRALQGFGPAAFLPSGVMLLGSIYRPGPRKNLVFSLYGAFAPMGFFTGILFAGVAAQVLAWSWFFWIGSCILATVGIISWLCVPNRTEDRYKGQVKMDWWGTAAVVPGLALVIFALTDGSHAPHGWATPYIPASFVVGCLFLCAFVYIEGWVADQPLLPFQMFSVKGMKPLAVALFLQYGTFGIFLFYASFYIEEVAGASPLLTAAWFAPMCVGGLILTTIGGLILHLLPGRILLLVSGIAYIISVLLFAVIPVKFNYWAYIFPAMVCTTLGIDITYNVSNIFITTSLPKSQQGLAGAFMNSLLFLGIAVFLSFADLAVSETEERGKRESFKIAFWLATALSVAGLVVMFLGVNIGRAKSDLTQDEKAELANELTRRRTNDK